jgi:hypothetical protein
MCPIFAPTVGRSLTAAGGAQNQNALLRLLGRLAPLRALQRPNEHLCQQACRQQEKPEKHQTNHDSKVAADHRCQPLTKLFRFRLLTKGMSDAHQMLVHRSRPFAQSDGLGDFGRGAVQHRKDTAERSALPHLPDPFVDELRQVRKVGESGFSSGFQRFRRRHACFQQHAQSVGEARPTSLLRQWQKVQHGGKQGAQFLQRPKDCH